MNVSCHRCICCDCQKVVFAHALQCDDIGAWNLRRPSNGTAGFGTPVVLMRTPRVLSRVSPVITRRASSFQLFSVWWSLSYWLWLFFRCSWCSLPLTFVPRQPSASRVMWQCVLAGRETSALKSVAVRIMSRTQDGDRKLRCSRVKCAQICYVFHPSDTHFSLFLFFFWWLR